MVKPKRLKIRNRNWWEFWKAEKLVVIELDVDKRMLKFLKTLGEGGETMATKPMLKSKTMQGILAILALLSLKALGYGVPAELSTLAYLWIAYGLRTAESKLRLL